MRNRPSPAPFLFLSIRAQEAAADDEYSAVMRFGGLDEGELHRIRLDREPLGQVDLDRWSGVILGGGPYNVSDSPADKSADQRRAEADVLTLLNDVVARDFPFLGCCYGIGTLGVYIGATVDRAFAEPIGSVQISLTPAGRSDPLFVDVPDAFEAFVGTQGSGQRVAARRRIASHVTSLSKPSGWAGMSTRRSSIPNWT